MFRSLTAAGLVLCLAMLASPAFSAQTGTVDNILAEAWTAYNIGQYKDRKSVV